MKLIKAKELGFEPAGTIFSEVSHFSADELNDGSIDDIEINGFSLMCGGDKKGFFL